MTAKSSSPRSSGARATASASAPSSRLSVGRKASSCARTSPLLTHSTSTVETARRGAEWVAGEASLWHRGEYPPLPSLSIPQAHTPVRRVKSATMGSSTCRLLCPNTSPRPTRQRTGP